MAIIITTKMAFCPNRVVFRTKFWPKNAFSRKTTIFASTKMAPKTNTPFYHGESAKKCPRGPFLRKRGFPKSFWLGFCSVSRFRRNVNISSMKHAILRPGTSIIGVFHLFFFEHLPSNCDRGFEAEFSRKPRREGL